MWLTPDNTTISSNQPYTSTDGTQYPASFPKSQIGELLPVTLTAKPATTQHQSTSYTIVDAVQVWTVTDWTPEQIEQERLMSVPQSVTMRQARLVLLANGFLADVNAAIQAMEGTEGEAARIEWEYAATVNRNSPLISAMGTILGLDDAALDTLFIAAAAIQ